MPLFHEGHEQITVCGMPINYEHIIPDYRRVIPVRNSGNLLIPSRFVLI
jgi:hypothetical protein